MGYFISIFIIFLIICMALNIFLNKQSGKAESIRKMTVESILIALVITVFSIILTEMIRF